MWKTIFRKNYLGHIFFLSGLLITTLLFSYTSYILRLGDVRNGLLLTTRAIAQGIEQHEVEQLQFTPADSRNAAYWRLKQQLENFSKVYKHRSIYTVALREGKYIFGPESIPVDDPLASPPGTVYAEPSAGLIHVFKSGHPKIYGPYKDEYGEFISAFVPVINDQSHKIMMVVAIDIALPDLYLEVANSVLIWPLLALLLMGIYLTLILKFTQVHQRLNCQIILLGVFVTASLATLEVHRERSHLRALFAEMSFTQQEVVKNFFTEIYETQLGHLVHYVYHAQTTNEITLSNESLAHLITHTNSEGLAEDYSWWLRTEEPRQRPLKPETQLMLAHYQKRMHHHTGALLINPQTENLFFFRNFYTPPAKSGPPAGVLIAKTNFNQYFKNYITRKQNSAVEQPIQMTLFQLEEGRKTHLWQLKSESNSDQSTFDLRHFPLFIGGSTLVMDYAPGTPLAYSPFVRGAWPTLLFGLIIMSLLLFVVSILHRRQKWLEVEVLERTARINSMLEKSRRYQQILLEISALPRQNNLTIEELAMKVSVLAAQALKTERMSIWLSEAEQSQLRCINLYTASDQTHQNGAILKMTDFPNYFDAFYSGRAIDAHDAQHDSRTLEFRDIYLQPNGIQSMLDAAIRHSGSVVGVVCAESVNEQRAWDSVDIDFISAVADNVAMVLLHIERMRNLLERDHLKKQVLHSSKLASIGTLAAGVAHEINNPLSVISGFIDIETSLLAPVEIPEKIRLQLDKNIASQKKCVARIAQIVKGLKSFSRSDDEKSADISLHQIIENTLSLYQNLYQKAGIQFQLELNANTPCVHVSEGKIQQVIANLLNNARDALDGCAQPTITIKTEIESKEKRVVCAITDNGHGMDSATVEKIFDPFFTTKEEGKGTGLGLSITQSIVESYHGHIEVTSQKGVGTTFIIKLPLINTAPTPQPIATTLAEHRGKGKILVVDDEHEARTHMTSIFQKQGFKVTTAKHGLDAIHLIQKESYAYIVTDMQMPFMNGAQLIQEALNFTHIQQSKFILISEDLNNKMMSILEQRYSQYVVGKLAKPVTESEIEQILAAYPKIV